MKWKYSILIMIGWLAALNILSADYVRKTSLKTMDVMNLYNRKRILIGLGFGINQNFYKTGTHLNQGFNTTQGSLDLQCVDDVYGEAQGNGFNLVIWGDYWINRHWGIIAQLGYDHNQFSHDGKVTVKRYYGGEWDQRGAITTQDKIEYKIDRVSLSLAPKFTFRNVYVYGGFDIAIPISSNLNHSSELDTLYFLYNDPAKKSHTKTVNESIPGLKSMIPSVIGGCGLYLPITRRLWCLPEFKFQRILGSIFSSPTRKYLVLDPQDGKESGYLLQMSQPKTEIMTFNVTIHLVYRF